MCDVMERSTCTLDPAGLTLVKPMVSNWAHSSTCHAVLLHLYLKVLG